MYDDYPSPPSTSSSSSRLRALPHLTHSSPLSYTTGHQRASKASDIAHLLDPSYSPTRPNPYLNQMIYVDHAGEAHDPDFRLFAPASYSPKRREFLTCESDDDDADDDDNNDDSGALADDADDGEAPSLFYYPPRSPKRASFDSARSASHLHPPRRHAGPRPDSRASDPVYSRTAVHDDAYAAPFAYTYSFEEQREQQQQGGYVSDDEPRREVNKLRRRRASLEHDRPVEQQREQPAAAAAQQQVHTEWTSACSNTTTIRRQWHALRLRTQVAAFRARKRVTRIVSPSTG